MEGALNASTVVIAKVADVLDHPLEVIFGDFVVAEHDFAARVARLGEAAKIHHDFEQPGTARLIVERFADARREGIEEEVEVVGDDLFEGEGRELFSVCHVLLRDGHGLGRDRRYLLEGIERGEPPHGEEAHS